MNSSLNGDNSANCEGDSTAALCEEFFALLDSLKLSASQNEIGTRALKVATITHKGQTRRGDTPYIDHPLRVALSAVKLFGVRDLNLIIAALLHDTVEDRAAQLIQALGETTSGDEKTEAFNLLSIHFGDRVSEVVKRLTNPDFDALVAALQSKGDLREPRSIKQSLYQQHFLEILAEDPEAFLIKLADFGENALKLGQLTPTERAPLARKYGPVILATISALEKLPAEHPLLPLREAIRDDLLSVYQRDYTS
jgi:(p)ppGpp synthase/HD superfamily hydrolase